MECKSWHLPVDKRHASSLSGCLLPVAYDELPVTSLRGSSASSLLDNWHIPENKALIAHDWSIEKQAFFAGNTDVVAPPEDLDCNQRCRFGFTPSFS